MTGHAFGAAGTEWKPTPDPEGHFSTGIPDFDRLLGGGFRRGSFVLYDVDAALGPSDLSLLLKPTWLNFLHHSHGILAVLPARQSPEEFRTNLLSSVSRRLFDSRVRVIDYVHQAEPAPHVVALSSKAATDEKEKAAAMQRMTEAERAVSGARSKPFLEMVSLEINETLFGAETAGRMYLFGMKRTRDVGNLGIAIARPALGCTAGVRSLADYEFNLRRSDVGLRLEGVRPVMNPHVVTIDRLRGPPYVSFVPTPRRD
jgi:hypothetical protein